MFIIHVCRALEKEGVRYAVVGGYAVALHGAVRGTVDVDIVIAWTLENLQHAEKALHAIGLISRLPITAKALFEQRDDYTKNRNLIAWNFYNPKNPTEQVDLIITHDLSQSNFISVQTAHGAIHVLSRDDLIAMKKASGRPQDLEDVRTLEQL